MPFGLVNDPATFQRALDLILTKLKLKTCLMYTDEVVVYFNTPEQHITCLDEMLSALGKSGISLNFRKRCFFSDSIEYLGHIIRPGRLTNDETNKNP